MKEKISIRQFSFLFLFISFTALFTSIPTVSAYYAPQTAYIGILYGALSFVLYGFLLLFLIKKYPNMHFYDILQDLFGKFTAKAVIFFYGLWAFLNLLFRISNYTTMMRLTLVPSVPGTYLILLLFLLVLNMLLKGKKTLFRFSEFLYGFLILLLFLLLLLFVPSLSLENFQNFPSEDLKNNLSSLPNFCSISGNLVLVLFFSDKLLFSNTYEVRKKRIFFTIFTFSAIALISTIVSVMINGTYFAGHFSYPIYQAFKNLYTANLFERFDLFITFICLLSEFVAVSAFSFVLARCFNIVFGTGHTRILSILALTAACGIIIYQDISQYTLSRYYQKYILPVCLFFQYIPPLFAYAALLVKTLFQKLITKK